MEKILKLNKSKEYYSKLFLTLLILSISFCLAFSSHAFLFNPFILSTIYTIHIFSPYYVIIYLGSFIIFASLKSINFGIEILILSLVCIIINYLDKKVKSKYYFKYGFFIVLLISLSIRYLMIDYSLENLFSCFVSSFLAVLMSISIEKVRYFIFNKYDQCEEIYKLIFISLIVYLILILKNINLAFLSLFLLIISKYSKKEIILSELIIAFLYNYLYSNISFELFFIYSLSIFFAILIKEKYRGLVFLLTLLVFYIIKYPLFYKDLLFYLNLLITIGFYLFPNDIDFLRYFFANYDAFEESLELKISDLNSKVNKVTNYLSLIKESPIKSLLVEDEVSQNLEKSLCFDCQNHQTCPLIRLFKNYVVNSLSKDDKEHIIESCFYPYKLIKRIQNANKNYMFLLKEQNENNSKINHFNVQIETILNPLIHQNKEENDIEENNIDVDYEIISKGFESNFNGDSSLFLRSSSHFIIAISDGMGHGEKSSDLSKYTLKIFKALYSMCKDIKQVLVSLNSLIKMKTTQEIYSTFDVIDISLTSQKMDIYKCGSFPSFIISNDNINSFDNITTPLGIVDEINIKYDSCKLMKDDVLIMMSDGFGSDLLSIINQSKEDLHLSLEEYIQKLYLKLDEKNNQDDKTLIVIKII